MRKKVWRECFGKKCESPDKCREATEIFNFFEMLSLAYNSGFTNRMILKDAFKVVFNQWYNQCEPWLIKQSELEDDEEERKAQKHITALHREWS